MLCYAVLRGVVLRGVEVHTCMHAQQGVECVISGERNALVTHVKRGQHTGSAWVEARRPARQVGRMCLPP